MIIKEIIYSLSIEFIEAIVTKLPKEPLTKSLDDTISISERSAVSLIKKESDDIERSDHIQFLITEISSTHQLTTNTAVREPVDETNLITTEGKKNRKQHSLRLKFHFIIFLSFLMLFAYLFISVLPQHLNIVEESFIKWKMFLGASLD